MQGVQRKSTDGRVRGFRLQTCRGLEAKETDLDLGRNFSPRGNLADLADRWGRGEDVAATLADHAFTRTRRSTRERCRSRSRQRRSPRGGVDARGRLGGFQVARRRLRVRLGSGDLKGAAPSSGCRRKIAGVGHLRRRNGGHHAEESKQEATEEKRGSRGCAGSP
jgi:hypothetical protein